MVNASASMYRENEGYHCGICTTELSDMNSLVEHLRTGHEIIEIVSYAATTMSQDQERDKIAKESHRQFEQIKRELVGN
jgi:hypothetical protein